MLKKMRIILIGAAILMAGVILTIIMNFVRSSMILSMGIIATNQIQSAVKWIFSIVGGSITCIGLSQFVISTVKRAKQYLIVKKGQSFRSKTSSTGEIRDQLKIMKNYRTGLSDDIDDCLRQLDQIDSILSRFDQLITTNTADAVSGSKVGLEEIRQTLNANFKWVINSSIAAGNGSSNATEQCRDKIQRAIGANSRVLEEGEKFLSELADNISKDDASGVTVKLNAWMKTISEQNKQSRILGDEKYEN